MIVVKITEDITVSIGSLSVSGTTGRDYFVRLTDVGWALSLPNKDLRNVVAILSEFIRIREEREAADG